LPGAAIQGVEYAAAIIPRKAFDALRFFEDKGAKFVFYVAGLPAERRLLDAKTAASSGYINKQ
jgi:hypothetical protein